MVVRTTLAAALLAALTLAGCGGDDAPAPAAEPAPVTTEAEPATTEEEAAEPESEVGHVHGLAFDPVDGSLLVSTHFGLWRLGAGEEQGARIGDVRHDFMGFAPAGKGRLLGSGHPAPEDTGTPPLLGLIESRDGGLTWEPVSLYGEADFHVLRAHGKTVYGFDATSGRFLASADRGATWEERSLPGPILDLAIDLADDRRLVATAEAGVIGSDDGGETWDVLSPGAIGYLAWDGEIGLFLVHGDGTVARSEDGGSSWEAAGALPDRPAAFAAGGGTLAAALHDGSLHGSDDGGATWTPLGSL